MTAVDSSPPSRDAPRGPTIWADRATRWALPATCLLLLAQVSPYWYATRDGASYLSIARTIAAGERPTNLGRDQLFFAPGYAVFVAPVYWLSDYPFVWLSLIHALLGTALLFLCHAWFARLSCADSTLLAAMCVANASAGIVLRRTLSEALFMPGLMATALVLNHLRTTTQTKLSWPLAIASGAALSALVLTRQAGLMLLPGFGCALAVRLWRREMPWGRALVTLTIVALPTLASLWALGAYERAMATAEARTYADYLRFDGASFVEQIVSGVRMRVSEIGRIVLPGMFKSSADGGGAKLLNLALYAVASAFIARGWWRALRAASDTLLWATPFYLALYVMWPFDEGIRLLVPFAPVWFLGLYRALPENVDVRHRAAAIVWALHFVVSIAQWLGDDLPDARHDHARWPQIQTLAAAIDEDREHIGWAPRKTDRQRVMLQYALDRPVTDLVARPQDAGDMQWIIAGVDEPVAPGYLVQETTGDYVLLRRQ